MLKFLANRYSVFLLYNFSIICLFCQDVFWKFIYSVNQGTVLNVKVIVVKMLKKPLIFLSKNDKIFYKNYQNKKGKKDGL